MCETQKTKKLIKLLQEGSVLSGVYNLNLAFFLNIKGIKRNYRDAVTNVMIKVVVC